MLVAVLLILTLVTGACKEVDRLADIGPRLVTTGGAPAAQAVAAPLVGRARLPLPLPLPTEGYEFTPLGVDSNGWLQYRIRIQVGGSPFLVAVEKLTPLFRVDDKGPSQYVADAYFAANPTRTPFSIQPDDEFTLSVPPDTFVVRWQQERIEDRGGPVRMREFVSERGDRLRMYLTDQFPILYELEPIDANGTATLQLHPDLAYLLGSGRLDAIGLARLVYRVLDPDIRQVQIIRQLAAEVKPGQSVRMEIDRNTTYLDPVREAMSHAPAILRVPYPGRNHLMRATFTRDSGVPYLAVEDALGDHADVAELPAGQVFRIEYNWDGTVRVSYVTGDDDWWGRRDPFQLRENERWAALYADHIGGENSPIVWGPGEPSDLESFPTARDPNRRHAEGERSYDYLVPGRAILLTFRPVRTRGDLRAEAELRDVLSSLRNQYHDDVLDVLHFFGSFVR